MLPHWMVRIGNNVTSVIQYLPSIWTKVPMALHSNLVKFNLEFSATARNLVMKQLFTVATKRCSGDHNSFMPFGGSGGVTTSILLSKYRIAKVLFGTQSNLNVPDICVDLTCGYFLSYCQK
jgi:hypothetical protein